MEYNLKHFAYIGDCVWELFVREMVIQKTQSQSKMHQLSTSLVCASAQAKILNFILDFLKSDELEIQKRGRNLKITINKKNNPQIHALATSFEVIVGYLYLNNKKRLEELFNFIKNNLNKITGKNEQQ